jgi:hypothetical protein
MNRKTELLIAGMSLLAVFCLIAAIIGEAVSLR